jgi:hypothetical protein
MSLILPPFAFAHCTDNLSGLTPEVGIALGTSVTAAAGANADGTAVSVIAALTHDVHYLTIGIGSAVSTTSVDTAALMDILVDPAGGTTWAAFIDDLVCGFCPAMSSGSIGLSQYYHFPVWIKSGSSIGAQVRSATASHGLQVVIWAYGEPSRPDAWWCGHQVESLGINAASSKGTDITPGSSTATFSWTNVGSATSGRYGAIQFGQNGSDGISAAQSYHTQIGIGSARVPGTPTFNWGGNTTESSSRSGHGLVWCDIPEGTQMQVGACCSGAAEVYDVALYGVM